MRKMFHAFYTPTEEEFDALWENALIVLDTNALLNLYRYSEKTYLSYLKILTEYKDRLWMPYTVGREFHKNRYESKHSQHKFYTEIINSLEPFVDEFKKALGKCRYHRFLDTDDILKKFKKRIDAQIKDIKATEEKHQALMDSDGILAEVTGLYDEKVGAPFGREKLEELYKKGKKRYESKTPPGYKDRDPKKGNSQYGDYLIWEAMIDKASESKQDLIFVTDDGKEDWWLSQHGKTIGPRPELLEEFKERSGQATFFYKPDRFLEYASKIQKQPVDESVTEEVSRVSDVGRDTITPRRYKSHLYSGNKYSCNPEIIHDISRKVRRLLSKHPQEWSDNNRLILFEKIAREHLESNEELIQSTQREEDALASSYETMKRYIENEEDRNISHDEDLILKDIYFDYEPDDED